MEHVGIKEDCSGAITVPNKESTKKRLDFEQAHQYGYSPILENDHKHIEEVKNEFH